MQIHIRNTQRSRRIDLKRTERDLRKALLLLGFRRTELSVLFTGGRRMLLLNRQYRGLCRTTDVLSFPMLEGRSPFTSQTLGDIVICVPVAASQAKTAGASLYSELLRLLVHGLLHLTGFDHEGSEAERILMEKKEKELLGAIQKMASKR